MTDNFRSHATELDSPVNYLEDVTPNDSADLGNVTRGIMISAAGDLKITTWGGSTITLTALTAGVIHPIRVKRVFATGTTATGIVAAW